MTAGEKSPSGNKLSHVNQSGEANMVDVGVTPETDRVAVARAEVKMQPETMQLINENAIAKGDVLATARIAGITGAKQTSALIPLCHPLPLTMVKVELELNEGRAVVSIIATAKTRAKTGVEMDDLTAASVAALTIYDMCKAVDRGMQISVHLVQKSGGLSGDYSRV